MIRTIAALLVAAGLAGTVAPAAVPTRAIESGVTLAGIRVGGLASEPARTKVETALARPLRVDYLGRTVAISPTRLGARASVDLGVYSALAATPGSRIAVPVHSSPPAVSAFIARLAKLAYRAPVDAKVIGASASGPIFEPARAGVTVDTAAMRVALGRLLSSGNRAPLQLITLPLPAARTPARFGPVIVVTRATNTLRLYDGRRLVRSFPVATGQAIYPTPAGVWHIKDKQLNPWWYPPTYDEWAKGLKPVPPGPDNPLGTRWMGLNAPGVGIHGTDAPSSIGYSASHGCIRMQVPDAEWLFQRVHVGTQVVIL